MRLDPRTGKGTKLADLGPEPGWLAASDERIWVSRVGFGDRSAAVAEFDSEGRKLRTYPGIGGAVAASGPAAYVIRWTGAHPTVLRLEGGVTREVTTIRDREISNLGMSVLALSGTGLYVATITNDAGPMRAGLSSAWTWKPGITSVWPGLSATAAKHSCRPAAMSSPPAMLPPHRERREDPPRTSRLRRSRE